MPRTLEEMARQGAALLLKRVPRPPTHRCPECADDVVGEYREDLRGVGHVECEVCGERLTDADLIEGAD